MTNLSEQDREALRAEVHAMRGTDYRGMSNCLHTRNDDESSCRAWADWTLASVTVTGIVRRARETAWDEGHTAGEVTVSLRIEAVLADLMSVVANRQSINIDDPGAFMVATAVKAVRSALVPDGRGADDPDMPLRATETGLGGSNTCSDVSPSASDADRAVKRSRLFADSDEIAGDRAMTRRALGLDDGVRGGGA